MKNLTSSIKIIAIFAEIKLMEGMGKTNKIEYCILQGHVKSLQPIDIKVLITPLHLLNTFHILGILFPLRRKYNLLFANLSFYFLQFLLFSLEKIAIKKDYYLVLGTKHQFLRYACAETSHLQKQTPYFQPFASLELGVFYLSTIKTGFCKPQNGKNKFIKNSRFWG